MKLIISLVLSIFLLSSCTKVINLDLNSSNPKYVIEGVLFGGTNDFSVQVTQTTDYFNPTQPVRVKGATVILVDENSNSYPLVNQNNGIYKLNNFSAIVGKTYTLKVTVENNSFQAVTTVPALVEIDNVDFIDSTVTFYYQDPPDIDNYYRVSHHFGEKTVESINADYFDDFGVNGSLSEYSVFSMKKEADEQEEDENPITSGDTIFIELRSIDFKTSEYFRTLEAAKGSDGVDPGAVSPANPISNWSNNALGYFGGGNSNYEIYILP